MIAVGDIVEVYRWGGCCSRFIGWRMNVTEVLKLDTTFSIYRLNCLCGGKHDIPINELILIDGTKPVGCGHLVQVPISWVRKIPPEAIEAAMSAAVRPALEKIGWM